MSDAFDVIVIGAGPGGYVCAIRAAQLGLKVACVEKRETLGGTCLNVGCIPSKALLQSSELFDEAQHKFADHGVGVGAVKLDLARMLARKGEVVGANVKGVEFLFRKNKVTWLKGEGSIQAPGTVSVAGKDYSAKHIVIASGSESIPLPGVEVDEKQIVTSTGGLELTAVPKHLVVIGGGYIGLELGSVWRRLGAEVTVVEFLDRLVPSMDLEVGKAFERILAKQGIKTKLKTKVMGATKSKKGVTLTLEAAAGGAAEELTADVVLVAIGRRPYVAGLGLDKAGVALDERGRIKVDGHYATNVPGIYAIGDLTGPPWLAHKASHEGIICVEAIAGLHPHAMDTLNIPGCTYCRPQVASVGLTEAAAKAKGHEVKVGRFPFIGNGKAIAMGEPEGFVKTVFDAKTGALLGAHMVGPEVTEMIQGYGIARTLETTEAELMHTVFPHPTVSEAMHESVLDAYGRVIHI